MIEMKTLTVVGETLKEGLKKGIDKSVEVAKEILVKGEGSSKILQDLFSNDKMEMIEGEREFFNSLKEKENSHYEKMKDAVKTFFKDSLGIEIKIEPLGMPRSGQVDIFGINDESGQRVIGEIKSKDEAKGSTEQWWSDWKGRLENLYSEAINKLSVNAKGWCAVVDGQLREYCEIHGVTDGYLVVESGEQFDGDIKETLDFLKQEGRIKDFEYLGQDEKGNYVYRIDYA